MVQVGGSWYEEIFIKSAKDDSACKNPCGYGVAEFDTELSNKLPRCDDVTDDGEDGMLRWSVYDRIKTNYWLK